MYILLQCLFIRNKKELVFKTRVALALVVGRVECDGRKLFEHVFGKNRALTERRSVAESVSGLEKNRVSVCRCLKWPQDTEVRRFECLRPCGETDERRQKGQNDFARMSCLHWFDASPSFQNHIPNGPGQHILPNESFKRLKG